MTRIEEFVNKHGSVILASAEPMTIGEVVPGVDILSIEYGTVRAADQPFVIVRERTKEEFLAQSPDIPRDVPAGYLFYEVRTD